MAKNDDNQEHEQLTEEQRITALEEKVGTNKHVLIGIALFLIVIISVSITIFTMAALGEEEPVAIESITLLQEQLATLQETVGRQSAKIKSLSRKFPNLEEQLENNSNVKLQSIILEQEKGHQEFLDALRSGMYDLAHMVPGSRTWLDVYNEKVDKADAHSKSREKDLKKLKLSTVNKNEEDDDPFFDGF